MNIPNWMKAVLVLVLLIAFCFAAGVNIKYVNWNVDRSRAIDRDRPRIIPRIIPDRDTPDVEDDENDDGGFWNWWKRKRMTDTPG